MFLKKYDEIHIDGLIIMIEIYGDEKILTVQKKIESDHVQNDTIYLIVMNEKQFIIQLQTIRI
jgi:hypothetical protein